MSDELLCGVLSPGVWVGTGADWFTGVVAPEPVFLGLSPGPGPGVVPLLELLAVEQVPWCVVPHLGPDELLAQVQLESEVTDDLVLWLELSSWWMSADVRLLVLDLAHDLRLAGLL